MSVNHFVLLESSCAAVLRYQSPRDPELAIPRVTLRAKLVLIFNAADLRCQCRDLPPQRTLAGQKVAAGIRFGQTGVIVRQGKVSGDAQHALSLFGDYPVFVIRAAVQNEADTVG